MGSEKGGQVGEGIEASSLRIDLLRICHQEKATGQCVDFMRYPFRNRHPRLVIRSCRSRIQKSIAQLFSSPKVFQTISERSRDCSSRTPLDSSSLFLAVDATMKYPNGPNHSSNRSPECLCRCAGVR